MNKFQIPNDWLLLQIGEVADVVAGGTPKASDPDNFAEPGTEIAWLTPADLSKYVGKYISYGARDLSPQGYKNSSAKILPAGTLLFSSRAPIGYIAIAKNEVSTNQGFKNFTLPAGIDSSYGYYFLRSIRSVAESMGTGTTFKEISGANAKKLPFILASHAEQKVIADKLDTLLAQVETTKARLERIPQILKHFRQSVLAAAVSGKLTKEWRYTEKTVGEVCSLCFDGPFGSKLKTADYTPKGVRVVRLENIGHLFFDNDKKTFVSEEKYASLKKNTLQEGDVLFSSFVDEQVRVCSLGKLDSVYINKADCFCLRPNLDEVRPEYLAFTLASLTSYSQIKEQVQGVTRPRINLKILKSLVFQFPSLALQTEIVGQINQLFTHADRIEQQVQAALERVNNLTQSILAKAFRGDLTEQWRKDNPELISGENSAAALLERIKAERVASSKTGKKTKTAKPYRKGRRT